MGGTKSTRPQKRIDTIDVLRGFALAGILYAHMVIWYTGAALPPDVYTKYDSTADGIALGIFGAVVFGKFFSVFSFLFGLSFYLHFRKKESGSANLGIYIWRLFLLFLIGLVHHLFWRGDILAIYAVLGVLLIFFRNLSPRFILILALLLITNVPTHLYEVFQTEVANAQVEFPMAGEAERYYGLVKHEELFTVLKDNWRSWPAKIQYQVESGRLLMTFGYFLLGLYAGRTGLFTSIEKHILQFKRWNEYAKRAVLFLLFLGLLMYLFDLVTIPGIKVIPELQWTASFLFSIYNACLTIFFITGITLLFRNRYFKEILEPLAAMGRMALTIYLMQTVFGLLLFYHFGLGLFDRSSPALNVLMGVGVFYLQFKFSRWWLIRFKQGPVEWLWKGLTYFKFNSIKRKDEEGYGPILKDPLK
ncbi:DUF418 domain-containing protein [Salinimicrobium terrae]|uniref:DUF418 domain-containing protein n=1 Tax=Salinimicrobium terrae TaxID=470866 RepID=UPI000413E881|nr:DUF418 domain-containing protein [Salinimicrobium terrae]